ncbi:MAG: hypothetical protein L6R28_07620 [Planctomycetes bacterium]|nr:hypothetical protein [Planctomycetota bacterium]
MPLERKPVESAQDDPGYPTSDQYAGDRRTFLTMLGVTAAAVVGLYSLRESKLCQRGADGTKNPTSNPQAISGGEPPFAQPQAAVAGKIQLVQPQAAVPGEAPAPQQQPAPQPPPEPARPQAHFEGDVAPPEPPAQPQAEIRDNVAAPEPAQPVAPVPGGIRAPAPAPAPVRPEVNVKGGVGVIRQSDPKTVAQKPRAIDEDF